MAFKFERLTVWEMAVDLSGEISDLVKTFPKDGLYVLTSQIKRASDSTSLDIAEGSTGQSNLEFKKFLAYARRSSINVVECFYLARRRKLVTSQDFDLFYSKFTDLIKAFQPCEMR